MPPPLPRPSPTRPSLTRRSLLRAGGVLAIGLAGCTSEEAPVPDSTDSTAPPLPTSTRGPPSDDRDPSPSTTPTTSPIGTGNNTADIEFDNDDDVPHTVTVWIHRRGQTDWMNPNADNTVRLAPGEREEWDIFTLDDRGIYDVTVSLEDGSSASYEWNLEEEPPGGWLEVDIEQDGSITIAYAIA